MLASREDRIETLKCVLSIEIGVSKSQPHSPCLSPTNGELVMCRRLGAKVLGIDRILYPVHDVVTNAILHIGSAILNSEKPPAVGLVLGEQQLRGAFAMEPAITRLILSLLSQVEFDHRVMRKASLVQIEPPVAASPEPRVAHPHLLEQTQYSDLLPPINARD